MKAIHYLYALLALALVSCTGGLAPNAPEKGPKVEVDSEKITSAERLEKPVGRGQTIDDIPKWSSVKDTDNCQVVKKKKMGGYYILCGGGADCKKAKKRCVLQRSKRSVKPRWKTISAPETYDKSYIYRCSCTK